MVVVHDRVEEWATLIGVDVPDVDGEGVKIDAAVAANILIISSVSRLKYRIQLASISVLLASRAVDGQWEGSSGMRRVLGMRWNLWILMD